MKKAVGVALIAFGGSVLGCGPGESRDSSALAQVESSEAVGKKDDKKKKPDTSDVPSECANVLFALGNDDRSNILPGQGTPRAGCTRLLLVVPNGIIAAAAAPAACDTAPLRSPIPASASPDLRVLMTTLEGMGYAWDLTDPAQLERPDSDPLAVPLGNYTTVLLANSALGQVALGSNAAQKLRVALEQGTDTLALGALQPELASLFGVEVQAIEEAGALGYQRVKYNDFDPQIVSGILPSEYIQGLKLKGAATLADFGGPSNPPAITVYQATARSGRAMVVAFPIFADWQLPIDAEGWGRAEMFVRTLQRVLTHGAVAIAPFPREHQSALLVRVDELMPGGTRRGQLYLGWLERFVAISKALHDAGIPLNLGIISRYLDPTHSEDNLWDSPDATRTAIRAALQANLAQGDVLIANGYTHQNGVGDDDVTGSDLECSNGTEPWEPGEFLPQKDQFERMTLARQELQRVFGQLPSIWETPLHAGNQDTYQAVLEAGFALTNEADTHLFPNAWGRANMLGGNLVNVPDTGGNIPLAAAIDFRTNALKEIMPRLARIGAAYFPSTQLWTDEEAKAIQSFATCARFGELWTPSVPEYATWWKARAATRIGLTRSSTRAKKKKKPRHTLTATVLNAPPNAAIIVRLPDGAAAAKSATVNGKNADFESSTRQRIAYVRVVLPPDAGAAAEVSVTY